LICDGCGTATPLDACALHDADVVYVAVASIGWTGSPYARGPHRCPVCEAGDDAVPHPRQLPAVRDDGAARVALTVTSPAAIVRITGDVDVDVVADLRAALDNAVALRPYVIVDLTTAGVLDSLGLGALVRGRGAARQRDGELLLVAPSRFVQAVLWSMRLHTAFRMFDTVPQAITATLTRE